MKTYIFALLLSFGFFSNAMAQNAQRDLEITSTYRINSIIPLGKYRLWPEIKNISRYDYKDVTYKVQFVAGDGTVEGDAIFTLHDYIGPGTSKKLKEQYETCPKDCKSINVSIVSATKLK